MVNRLIWFGKTTIGKKVFNQLKIKKPQSIFLDGDEIRDIFNNEKYTTDYSKDGRRKTLKESVVCVCGLIIIT